MDIGPVNAWVPVHVLPEPRLQCFDEDFGLIALHFAFSLFIRVYLFSHGGRPCSLPPPSPAWMSPGTVTMNADMAMEFERSSVPGRILPDAPFSVADEVVLETMLSLLAKRWTECVSYDHRRP